uniref:Cytochrome c oxidase subunit 2 n=1 Tax=Sacculina sp. 'Beibu Gulf' TaxID=2861897 RepID=A0A8F9R921_9CRUS|nr:cytochrome c oxidase subunit 2 [Sacculina sp. 'Beibu Gulf']
MFKYFNFSFNETCSPLMKEMLYFYDLVMLFMTFIVILSLVQLATLFFNSYLNVKFLDNNYLELLWTMTPFIILIFISIPSLFSLYTHEKFCKCDLTLKVIANQWFWTYEYSDFLDLNFDSYMAGSKILRLLDVDSRLILPMKTVIRVLVSSSDVLHSFTILSLGIKIDAIPGRLNQGFFYLMKPGIYYGQCSEICGVNHSFMPIMLESVSLNDFLSWLAK